VIAHLVNELVFECWAGHLRQKACVGDLSAILNVEWELNLVKLKSRIIADLSLRQTYRSGVATYLLEVPRVRRGCCSAGDVVREFETLECS
jgi:hypothetical protein